MHRDASTTPPPDEALAGWDNFSETHVPNAKKLCALLSGHNIECSVVGYPGGHHFSSAGNGFAAALPWLAGILGTPDVPARSCRGAREVAGAQSPLFRKVSPGPRAPAGTNPDIVPLTHSTLECIRLNSG